MTTMNERRAGKCACNWWSYVWGRKRNPHGSSHPALGWQTPRVNEPDAPDGWRVRISVPRLYLYGVAAGRDHPLRKTHMVREQIVAVRDKTEVRRTQWLCGATTFDAVLQKDEPRLVCSACLLVAQKRSVEPMPKVKVK